ncbi:MAG: hypothetical protein ABIJ39_04395 [Chloroflexota bacterium]
MLNIETLHRRQTLVVLEFPQDHLELCRLLAAAVVNRSFCQLLLEDPEIAIQRGYQGESFLLNDEERALLLAIRADSLTDLARQIAQILGERPITYTPPESEFIRH